MNICCDQTVLLRKNHLGNLENLIRITVSDLEIVPCAVEMNGCKVAFTISENVLQAEVWIDEPKQEREISVTVFFWGENSDKIKSYSETFHLKPPKHWEVHLLHISHHDPGYTDLPSHVLQYHYQWIDEILDEMDLRQDYPEDSRLRITIEQFWSLDYYLKHAPEERKDKLIKYLQKGDIELTALYGNLITEQLGHEEAYRSLYPAFSFANEQGIQITSALHNDIPGISWGMSRVLTDAGIKMLLMDFPDYYEWGYRGQGMRTCWDPKEIFGYDGPGAFYWRTPDDKKILLWSHYPHIAYWNEEWMESTLKKLQDIGFPYDCLYVNSRGCPGDNACYITAYADKSKDWNEKYAFPHIITSTTERFKEAFEKNVADKQLIVPEFSGEIPGQDYPLGAMSIAQVTSTARRTHGLAATCDKLLALNASDPMLPDQKILMEELYRDLFMADDHAYGFAYPDGPAMRASYWEKGVYAMRAAATAHDLSLKAFESIADRIKPSEHAMRLVVWNTSGYQGDMRVIAPMQEIHNCGKIYREKEGKGSIVGAFFLNVRSHVQPEFSLLEEQKFKLIDLDTSQEIAFSLEKCDWDDPMQYAPELSAMSRASIGDFKGMPWHLKLIAKDMPAFGYKTFALEPVTVSENKQVFEVSVTKDYTISNGKYQITMNQHGIHSIFDLKKNMQLLDPMSPYKLGDLLVRDASEAHIEKMSVKSVSVKKTDVVTHIDMTGDLESIYQIRIRLTLWQNHNTLDLSIRFFNDAKPLKSIYAAFPFNGNGFRYQSMLSVQEPAKNILPGAQSDFITAGDYIRIKESNILFSSKDTAVFSMGQLRNGYISPAHRLSLYLEDHEPLKSEDFCGGNLFALLATNNFRTNFMCSQPFDGLYQFSFTSADETDDLQDSLWGEREQNDPVCLYSDCSRGEMDFSQSLLDTGKLQCINMKKAECGDGLILRLWNHYKEEISVKITLFGKAIEKMILCDALEREVFESETVIAPANSVITIKIKDI